MTPEATLRRPFAVWAPDRDRVRLLVDDTPHPMRRDPHGWWHADVAGAGPGTDYAFLLDDDPTPLPDPRSRWQPHGVHGPSRLYDHTAFPWTDGDWHGRTLPGSVLYELHIGTFTPDGTFDGATGRLDHLTELGVDLVQVMPVNAFDGIHGWGYDGVLWGAVHEPYGGPDGFKRFVDACHARGIGVLLDVVYNHLGPSGAYLPRFAPYFLGENIWGPALNLDGPHSDEVRRHVIDNAVSWLRDYHLDGLRLDAVHALLDRRATPLLAELSAEVEALAAGLRRPLSLIAESDRNDPTTVAAREAGGHGLTAQWCDDIHHALHVTLTGERHGYYRDFTAPDALAHTLRRAFFHAGTWSSFRGRTHGAPIDTRLVPASRFVCYLQNHDQIGNRAHGDRITDRISSELALCGAAIVLCSPYTPMLFMGEEWAAATPWRFFASFPDPELAASVRQGRRREFADHDWDETWVPDPMDPETVRASTLDWNEPTRPGHARVLDTYRALIALRHSHPELTDPRLDRFGVTAADDGDRIVLRRGGLRLACNLGRTTTHLPLDAPVSEVLLSTAETVDSNTSGVTLPAATFAVLRVAGGEDRHPPA